jgi:hypothetical protein
LFGSQENLHGEILTLKFQSPFNVSSYCAQRIKRHQTTQLQQCVRAHVVIAVVVAFDEPRRVCEQLPSQLSARRTIDGHTAILSVIVIVIVSDSVTLDAHGSTVGVRAASLRAQPYVSQHHVGCTRQRRHQKLALA